MSTVGQRRRLSSNPESRAQFLYEARGESAVALKSYMESNGSNLTRQHNLALLTYLANNRKTTDATFLTALKTLRSQTDCGGGESSARLPLHQLVLSYNLALHAFCTRDYDTAKSIIYPICEAVLNDESGFEDVAYGDVKCKIAFLVVDCMLEIFDLDFVGVVLNWIERYVTFRSGASTADEICSGDETVSFQQESDLELKFRLHCYRARYLFGCPEEDASSLELNLKKARKELKNAMEIYNHNLSGKKLNGESMEDGTASIQDSVSPSVDSGHGIANDHPRHKNIAFLSNGVSNGSSNDAVPSIQNDDNQTPYEMRLSNAQNQHVLFLKAKLEYLKGNSNKSMKLCSEAQNTMDKNPSDDTTNILQAIYNNNMGLVHQSAGQFHLAMHYYALALSLIDIPENETNYISVSGVTLHSDGTMKQLSVEQLLYNTAICSQVCGNYVGSCECMVRFIQLSKKCSKNPFPWLHLSESYIGK
jgi:hypothetical protein